MEEKKEYSREFLDFMYRTMKKLHKNRRHHCDSCKNYKDSEISFLNFKRGYCSLNNYDVFSIEYCKHHTSKNKAHWYKYFRYICPVCGGEDKYKEMMLTERPEKYEDRNFVVERYDNCMEE